MNRVLVSLFVLTLVGCVDSGPVPFSTGKLFTGGSGNKVLGGSGGQGGSGGYGGSYGGSGGYGGSYGGSGGYGGGGYGGSGGGGCLSVGQSCSVNSDCCQTSSYGNTCIGDPIYQCAAKCYQSADCADFCCVQLTGVSYGACMKNSSYPCLP